MEEYLKQLNESQREAVVYTDGPSLVVAGAGSGKTRVADLQDSLSFKAGTASPKHFGTDFYE